MTDEELQARLAYIEGLRKFANVLEANPDLPVTSLDGAEPKYNALCMQVPCHRAVDAADARAMFARILRALDAEDWAEVDRGDPGVPTRNYYVEGHIAGMFVKVYAGRDDLSERRVVSREQVGDRVVETVEWTEPSIEAMLAGGESE